MLLFIPRSLCALKRITAKGDSRYAATQGIRIALEKGMYRAEATDGHRAIVVQGTVPTTEPPWPAFKEVPDDAFEAIIMPKDLERACKVGDDYLQSCFGLVGIATMGNDVCLGLGADVVTARMVEGKFPPIERVIPRKRPLFTFRVDPSKLFVREQAKATVQWNEMLEEIRDGLHLTFKELVDALMDKLTPRPDGTRKKLVGVDRLLGFLDTFKKKDVADDEQLRTLVDEVRGLLLSQDVSLLRKDQTLRELVQERMQSVKVVLDTLVVEAPPRQIVLRD